LAAVALGGNLLARVMQERDLIASGKRIREAIGAYYDASPGSAKTYPSALQYLMCLSTGTPTWPGQLLSPSGSGSGAYSEWKFVHQP
jgi:hypothetical protein